MASSTRGGAPLPRAPRSLALTGCAVVALSLGCAASPVPFRAAAPAPKTAAVEESPRKAEVSLATAVPSSPPAAASSTDSAARLSASDQELAEIDRRLRELNLNAVSAAVRTPIAPEPFRLSDLPSLVVPEPIDVATSAPVQTNDDPATELVVDWKGAGRPLGPPKSDVVTSVRISLSGRVYSRIRIGYAEGAVSPDGSGGVYVSCGGILPSDREATPKGGIQYRVVDAWFNTQSCAASIVARTSVNAPRLAAGMLYAFRQASAKSPEDEALTLIGPRFAHLAQSSLGGDASVTGGSFSRVTIPVRRGGGASVVARIGASTVREWSQMTGIAPVAEGELLVGIEITQGVEDPNPVAITYVGVPRPAGPPAQVNPKVVQIPVKFPLFDPFIRH
jgi:hypothetical protein